MQLAVMPPPAITHHTYGLISLFYIFISLWAELHSCVLCKVFKDIVALTATALLCIQDHLYVISYVTWLI